MVSHHGPFFGPITPGRQSVALPGTCMYIFVWMSQLFNAGFVVGIDADKAQGQVEVDSSTSDRSGHM